ncbi:MAG: hypothetical protein Q9214_004248 [Letrouitia sp. 1 TL-2023]
METEAALLAWVNTFSLVEDVKSLRDLNDGRIIWDILRKYLEHDRRYPLNVH